MKDHQIAEVVNQLRDIALEFHGAQQLRERIAHVIVPILKDAELPQPYAGAITLLETIAEHGAVAKFDDGAATPNGLLCKHFAEQLRIVANRQYAPVADTEPVTSLIENAARQYVAAVNDPYTSVVGELRWFKQLEAALAAQPSAEQKD